MELDRTWLSGLSDEELERVYDSCRSQQKADHRLGCYGLAIAWERCANQALQILYDRERDAMLKEASSAHAAAERLF